MVTGAFTVAGVLMLGAAFFNRVTKVAALGVDVTLSEAQAADQAAKEAAPNDLQKQSFVKATILQWLVEQKASLIQLEAPRPGKSPLPLVSPSPRALRGLGTQ